MRKINADGTVVADINKLAAITLNRTAKTTRTAKKELDMMAWGFKEAKRNLPPAGAPLKKRKRRSPGAAQYVYENTELPKSTWASMLLGKLADLRDDFLYRHDIIESKREARRDEREMKRMEKADNREMGKTKVFHLV